MVVDMSERADGGLFGELAEQAVPEGVGVAVPRLRQPERRQVELRAVSLEELVADDHRVRQVWAFALRLDLSALYRAIKAVEGRPGHPPADPRLLVALWLQATVEGVGSARALARLCAEHHAYRWLCGGVGVNHKTLADFRVAHGGLLDGLLADSFAAMLRAGMASLERVAQDGVRVRAAAGAASFRRQARLVELRRQAAERVAALRAELDADPAVASRRQAAARERAARERVERIEAALAALDTLKAKAFSDQAAPARSPSQPPTNGTLGVDGRGSGPVPGERATPPPASSKAKAEPRVSTTDAEARVMKMADGGFRPAYNLQFASDTKSGMIAAVSLDNRGSDMGKMAPMVGKLAAQYGRRPSEHLADGGYASLADIQALEGLGTTAYVPVPKPKDEGRDRHQPRADDSKAVAAWRQRMGGTGARDIYKQRAATAECANAQARNRGLRQFPVRGLTKVTAIALWFALAHNMMRILALTGGADSVL
jgi:transposase